MFDIGNHVRAGSLTIGIAGMLCLLLETPSPAAEVDPSTQRVSVSSGGDQTDHVSQSAAMSTHGRYVAFISFASNLVPGDTNRAWDVFVRDRLAGTTQRVSVDSSGDQANDGSGGIAISADGRYVAFGSDASNLVPGDTNDHLDVFVHDRIAGTTRRVSVSSSGEQIDFDSSSPAISAHGRYVAFEAHDVSLSGVFVWDRRTETTQRVSVTSTGDPAEGVSNSPAISAHGRYVAFQSTASDLVPGDTNGQTDVFVRDRATGTTQRVSVTDSGAEVKNGSLAGSGPVLSAHGRYVAFGSSASDLVPGDTNGEVDLFVRDRVAGTTQRVSIGNTGAQANARSDIPALSAHGRYVAFHSPASNLVPEDTNNSWDVFVRDRVAGTTQRVSISENGAQADGTSTLPALSAHGRYVAFTSNAPNLVPADTNATYDVFVRDRGSR